MRAQRSSAPGHHLAAKQSGEHPILFGNVATEKKSLGQILKQLEKHTGEFHTDRLNVKIPAEKKDALLARLSAGLDSIGPFKVQKFITTDGY